MHHKSPQIWRNRTKRSHKSEKKYFYCQIGHYRDKYFKAVMDGAAYHVSLCSACGCLPIPILRKKVRMYLWPVFAIYKAQGRQQVHAEELPLDAIFLGTYSQWAPVILSHRNTRAKKRMHCLLNKTERHLMNDVCGAGIIKD